jgi:dsDNA-specific endonuclease/ATPase MutS2
MLIMLILNSNFAVMARGLKVGDMVSFLDEVGGGIVLAVQNSGVTMVETEDGFRIEMHESGLVLRQPDSDKELLKISEQEALQKIALAIPDPKKKRKAYVQPPGKKSKREKDAEATMEIDLHLHQILDNDRGMSAGDKLSYQLNYFERMLSKAIHDKKRKLIAIHGIGEGRLRDELHRVLKHYPGIRFYDADPRRYGSGATEIEILTH